VCWFTVWVHKSSERMLVQVVRTFRARHTIASQARPKLNSHCTHMDLWLRVMGLCIQVSHSNHSEVPIKTTESNCKRPMVYHQCNDPLRSGHPYRSRCHPQKKQQGPSQTTISSKPTLTIPIKGQYPTETERKMAN